MSAPQPTIPCRLCSMQSRFVFPKIFYDRITVSYYRCESCEALQSEQPYWLDEAYAEISLLPDVSTFKRMLLMRRYVFLISKIFNMSNQDRILDFGGGNGALVRMLRDLGLDTYRLDLYVKNLYALGYDHQEHFKYKMVTAFQVLEHFVNPSTELDDIFGFEPDFVFITTGLYNNQDKDWGYLNAHGRHIFCFSSKSRQYIAERYGYYLADFGDTSLFCKLKPSVLQRFLLRLLFSGRFSRLVEVSDVLLPSSKKLQIQDSEEAYKAFYIDKRIGTVNGP